MLSAEEAGRRLASLGDRDWLAKAEARADALPAGLREVAREFLVRAPDRFDSYESLGEFRRRQDIAAVRLDEMSDDDRAAVMGALHPRLGPQLTRWWVDEQARPYQRGPDRKGFRAPGRPELTRYFRGTDLRALAAMAGPFDADPAWLAAWGGYLVAEAFTSWTSLAAALGSLLASAIDLGGEAGERTLLTLIDVGNGADPVGVMGQHVIAALLGSSRPEGWEFMERLLLAAQLQEGLRQSILEAADMGHPAAFDRMLAIVLDRKLLRFASTVRAAGTWLGYGASVSEIPLAEARLRRLVAFRASPADRAAALASGEPWEVFLALCAGGMRDVAATIPELGALAGSPSPDVRAAMLFYVGATGFWGGRPVTAEWLDDTDVRVAAIALSLLDDGALRGDGYFDAMGRLAPRLPARERQEAGPGVRAGPVLLSRAAVADRMIHALGDRPASDLAPWLRHMSVEGRGAIVHACLGVRWEYRSYVSDPWNAEPELLLTPQARQLLASLLDDRSPRIRASILFGLAEAGLEPADVTAIEGLLTRSATDLRRSALEALAKLPPQAALESVARLAASGNQLQREAAVELARQVAPADDGAPADEAAPAADASGPEDIPAAIAAGRSAPVIPRRQAARARWDGELAWRIVAAIDALAEEHRNVPVTLADWRGSSQEVLFGNVGGSMPWFPDASSPMLLGDVFLPWWRDRPAALRGPADAQDALAACLQAHLPRTSDGQLVVLRDSPWVSATRQRFTQVPPGTLRHGAAVEYVTRHLATSLATPEVVDACLDAYEDALASIPDSVLAQTPLHGDTRPRYGPDWRDLYPAHPPAVRVLSGLLRTRPELFTAAQLGRWHGLERWLEAPVPDAVPHLSWDELPIAAHEAGAASDDDIAALLLDHHSGRRLFGQLTSRRAGDMSRRHPGVAAVAGRLRDRMVAAELSRGDLRTPTSYQVREISSVTGARLAAQLLAALGARPLARGWRSSYSADRDATLSHLVRVSYPGPGESGAGLSAAAAATGVRPARLIDLALYAPQWAVLVEEALDWPGLADGALWLHAHTKDTHWRVEDELRESWAAMTAERTPLSAGDLIDGAVDVEWFRRANNTLGAQRWAVVHKAARHASGGNGHRRAQVFAAAMLGQADEGTLLARVQGKRDQDAVRALGLLQLPADPAARAEVTQRRYAALREFERGSRKFGQLRQASEKTAVRIGIENLARTAGYPDPQRFTWAVEAQEAGDLADGPVLATAGDVTLTLSVDAEGTPGLTVSRGGRALKSVPAALRKDPGIAALTARKAALGKQATRVRQSLEAAMIAQDAFTTADFADLGRHPVVAPMLAQLVWVAEDGRTRMLERGGGQAAMPAPDGPLRIAHPGDLIADGSWVTWQERLFAAGRRQPFKQVFRELYALTGQERADGPVSRRYEGHQLQPRQAQALLITRGWVIDWESGEAARPFHRHGLTARVTFDNRGLTLADVDLPVIDGACFTRRGEYLAQPLDSVPGVVFSEAMRDLDLVVSVAHAGGVDPEATASTTQMRAALILQTARLLKLTNIELAGGHHVIITGRLGEYSLHLGSGTVHRRPGGAVCIIPVRSQYRGRLFLPFADDDPKTAEVVSKALLLARDHEIKDPTILEQLRS